MEKEYVSKHLGIPYVYLSASQKYVCSNGVVFTKGEYLDGIDLKAEYEKRESNGELYDYAYARSTGLLRKKAVRKPKESAVVLDRTDEAVEVEKETNKAGSVSRSVIVMCLALTLTSFGSMYISTVHTATYLFDYVDKISAWLMSGVITVYCATAFEVVLLFHDRRRYVLSMVFAFLWTLVILFSMVTTVSIFYDKYNFSVVETQEVNKEADSQRLSLELLRTKEKDLRDSVSFKKTDIEYRRAKDYATTTVRLELESLQKELQANLEAQRKLLETTPEAVKKEGETVKKESLFAFLGRLMHLEGGILEFIMSTLSAVFINLISPLSVSVVISFLGGMKNESD